MTGANMAPLPQIKTATAIAIEAAYEAKRTPRHGYRLPPSRLGTECERALWYSFRWCTPPAVFDGRLLRLFETGDSQEARMVADLRLIGCDVLDCDPDDDTKQIGISFAYGHGYGFLDAEVIGLPDAPMTVHVAEMKTHNQKSFDALQRHGVEKSKPEHYAQTMIYMHKRARDRGLYMAVNKNTDELYFERIEYDIAKAVRLERKAERIVFASVPPTGISTDPDFFGCRFCDHRDRCFGDTLPEKNCRTCAFATPADGGKWVCDHAEHNHELDRAAQEAGCADHIFIPSIVPGAQIDADLGEARIIYALPDGRTYHNRSEAAGGDYYA
jgi:cation diffusion facilitator CzcD-associated flavoprotein CzcO